jgi:hypothetical protein
MAEPAPESQPSPSPRSLPIPTTFGGVATLAGGPVRWLGAWQTAVALVSAIVVSWSLGITWGRALIYAAAGLPDQAEISGGELHWAGPVPTILHHGPFLGIAVDPLGVRGSASGADLTLSIEHDRVAIRSVLGWLEVPYPPDLTLSLARFDVVSGLGAWMSPALIAVALGVFAGLLLIWALLASVYAVVLRLISGAGGRLGSLANAWKLAAASLLLPALLMTAAVGLYAIREIGLPGLIIANALHLVAGWIYGLGSLARLPKPLPNPFLSESEEEPPAGPVPDENPFQRS